MDGMQHEQFIKALNGLVELAKTKKNVLEYNEINDAFRGFELTIFSSSVSLVNNFNAEILHGFLQHFCMRSFHLR